ncbi:MAG: hypothetical protein ACTSVY_10450 [Candidatus Helarchaeota archaeon]
MSLPERLEFNEISTDWNTFEEKVKKLNIAFPKLEIKNILWPDDGITIDILEDLTYLISMTIKLLIKPGREYNLLINNAKIVLLLELGFKMSEDVRFSTEYGLVAINCFKEERNIKKLVDTLKKLHDTFHNFKLMIQMKDNATYVFQNDTLNHLFPYIERDISPKNELVKSIVSTLIEAYAEDRRNKISETNCGKRTALKLVEELEKFENTKLNKDKIKWYPEKLYRILRKDEKIKKYKEISKEVYQFIEMVPYSGRGKRLEGSDCAIAYQVKKDNRYVSTRLKELGIPLTIIFPGG